MWGNSGILNFENEILNDFKDVLIDYFNELKNKSNVVNDPVNLYSNDEVEFWKNKYLTLLEEYTELLKKGTSTGSVS